MLGSNILMGGYRMLLALLGLSLSPGALAREPWDQAKAKEMVARVLEVEKAGKLPWNAIPWRVHVANALKEAQSTGKPLFVFFFVPQAGPPREACGLEGRLLRTYSLADDKIVGLVKAYCVPVKVPLKRGENFPLDWPALKKWATAFRFSNGRGFAGCSLVSSDLALEYGNSGSAQIPQMLESPAFSPVRVHDMLVRGMERLTEERSLRVERRISELERKREIARFRTGVTRAVQMENRRSLPPAGYSLEQALELYRMAGAIKEN